MSPTLNLLLAVGGGPVVIAGVLAFCRWSATQHAKQTARDIERIEARRAHWNGQAAS